MILKNRLKELRARDGLNQSELAKLAGSPSVHQSLGTGGIYPFGYYCHHHRPGFKEPVENVLVL